MASHAAVVPEPAARAFVEATANPPFLYELSPASTRPTSGATRARRTPRACARPASPSPPCATTAFTHDFMMLNPLSRTHATRAAVAQAISVLRMALHSA